MCQHAVWVEVFGLKAHICHCLFSVLQLCLHFSTRAGGLHAVCFTCML